MTGDRVAEIRGRVEAATPGPWQSEPYLIEADDERVRVTSPSDDDRYNLAESVLLSDADLIANAPADLAYLLAENARLRAQLDTVRELADKWERHGRLQTPHGRQQGWTQAARQAARDFHAALNQGGETNGE